MAWGTAHAAPRPTDSVVSSPIQDQAVDNRHLSPPILHPELNDEPPPFNPTANDHVSLSMLQTLIETPTALKGLHSQDARRRVEAAFRRAQPDPRPNVVSIPSTEEIRSVLEQDTRLEGYPTIESQMTGEGSRSEKERSRPSWTSSAEAFRPKRPSHPIHDEETIVRTKSLPTIDHKLRQAHAAAQNHSSDFRGTGNTVETLRIPSQIRLRKPKTPKTHNELVEGIFAGPHVATTSGLQGKAAPVQAATTRTAVHIFMPEEQPATDQAICERKLSATLQVVRSRDSIYEIIWEESLTNKSSGETEAASVDATDLKKLADEKKVDTRLAAWSWGFDPTHIYVYEGVSNDTSFQSSNRVPAVGKDVESSLVMREPSAHPAHLSSSSEDDLPSPPMDDAVVQRRRSSAPAGIFEGFADAVETIDREPPTNSKGVDAIKRRKLLGTRKPSEAVFEEDHFKQHRDSLMLAHERIFHQDGLDNNTVRKNAIRGKKKVRVAPAPRIESLKRSTWTKPLPKAPPTPWQDPNEINSPDGTKPINKFATKVRTPDRQSLSEPSFDSSWLRLGAEEIGPIELSSDTHEPGPPPRTSPSSESSFLALSPETHSPMAPTMSGAQASTRRSETAIGSTAASRAKQVASDKTGLTASKLSAAQTGRLASFK